MKTILCIEDKPTEMEKAKKAVEAAGYRAETLLMPCSKEIGGGIEIIKAAIERSAGVLTDLHFIPFGAKMAVEYKEGDLPAGLMIVIHALGKGVPVVICSDMDTGGDENYHHGKKYSWLSDWYFYVQCPLSKQYPDHWDNPLMPTYLIGEKYWARAIEVLKFLMEAKQ
ncbi:MAG: hypothetical protein UR66_C0003G0128 [Candidatus Moranbacteria bacterium GW2011_GWE1_35_17]|nr:MAG: hypothetical protein UR66_C0003G0128 [Candidatus Moranbacteria bacterium GW2011_GWE1_35_17]KKP84564.1 MAG: hypothetical protein UR83_C0018G0011 [Candidatus Moranbacteria bacterium GW2011_GWF2_35_54]KKP84596.1 MAG: hypothetical protein UR82_C0002G0013 [Candidatus Moranbacteria bacterium GW2011_GWF1_35_5]